MDIPILGLSVAETDAKPEKTKKRVLELSKKAMEEDGAEVIILGCAGMSGYASEIKSKLGAKVLDPTAVALKTAEAMVDLGLTHSKVGLFARPPEKHFKGIKPESRGSGARSLAQRPKGEKTDVVP